MDFINAQADMVVCGEADSIPSMQAKVAESRPQLIVLGLRFGTGDTFEFIKALKAQYPKLPILVFSQFEETLFAERALRAGAKGYLMKKTAKEELLTAIRNILSGQIYVSRDIGLSAFQKSLETPSQNRPNGNSAAMETLSDREMHVFQLLGSGLSTKKIAEALNLSVKTIESHRENIKCKLSLNRGLDVIERATKWVEETSIADRGIIRF
jgi:DNA-binding NarL/FixJ family response regulator